MSRKFIIGIACLLISFGLATASCGQSKSNKTSDLRVILIRHGEKPDDGDNLSCSGLNRSLKLPAVIKAKFGVPDYIYVPAPGTGKQTKNCRMLQTATPLAVKYNLSINSNYDVNESDKLANSITKNKGTILVVWEHKELASIAEQLGVKVELQWDPADFDSIWVITFKHGTATLTKDTEGIKPSATCPL
jgi:hypothetical protein